MSAISPDALPSRNLPAEYYQSEHIYRRELERVFARQWLLVGHESLARRPGDYFVKQVGPESMIILRDSQGAVRAYFNVCRHRGFRLLADGVSGSATRISCPYHAWTYDTNGCLRGVPNARSGQEFEFAEWPLHEARCEVWHGWMYIYLSREPGPALRDVLGPVTDEGAVRQVETGRLKLAHREIYVVNANWKAMAENNCECYHCGPAHPSLSVACDHSAFFAPEGGGAHFPLRAGMATFSIDGRRVSDRALGPRLPEAFSTGFLLQPFFCGPVLFVDHAVSLELTPLTFDRTQLICEWYVHEDAVEGVDYERERLTKVFHVTNIEDGRLAERNWQGMQSMRFGPGPLHPREERGVRGMLDDYLALMAAE